VYVRTGGEGLFAVYSGVQFRAPVSAGDVLEVPGLAVEAG
jgi:acyl-CoA hydrolase